MRYLIGLACLAFSLSVAAETRTVTLSVPGMDCPVCPITIKKALNQVDGVDAVATDLDARTATVTYDDTRTDDAALTEATKSVGYPSSVMKE